MAVALRFRSHGQPHAQLLGWLFNYQIVTPGTKLVCNGWQRRRSQPEIGRVCVGKSLTT